MTIRHLAIPWKAYVFGARPFASLLPPLGHSSGLALSSTRRANRSSTDGSYQWSKDGFC
jgi:hypothetical protein